MSSNSVAHHTSLFAAIPRRHSAVRSRRILVGLLAALLLFSIVPTGAALAAESYVFSVGVLVKVDQRAITLGFEGGATETYRIGPATTFRSQNGDERKLEDFTISEPVLIITAEGDPTAVTVVDGGPAGWHDEAGPADIRGHENGCVCTAKSAEQLPR